MGECAIEQGLRITPEEAPFWWRDAEPLAPETRAVEPDCDVAIVGGGYTGLSAAITLAAAGRSVQVFECNRFGEGASSRNGGIMSGNLRTSYAAAVTRCGSARAQAMFREGVEARAFLSGFIKQHDIDCDLQETGRFTGALNMADYDAMAREADILQREVGTVAHAVARSGLADEVGSQLYCGGLVQPDISVFHPAKFVRALVRLAEQAGGLLHARTAVEQIEPEGSRFSVVTSRGRVTAGAVLMATNGYTGAEDRWLRRRLVPVKSRMIVTEELSENLMRHLMPKGRAMGEKRNLYRYFRPSPDGRRIMFGSREPGLRASPREAADHVRRNLVDVFPELETTAITHSWAGNVAFSRDELPGLFTRNGINYAVGYCGSGTVWATWLGRKAALKLLGDAEGKSAFDCAPPKAIPFYRGRPWFLPGIMFYYGLQDMRKLARAPR